MDESYLNCSYQFKGDTGKRYKQFDSHDDIFVGGCFVCFNLVPFFFLN